MIALSISVNGARICTAGLGARGNFCAVVSWSAGWRAVFEDGSLMVIAYNADLREHLRWSTPTLDVGDEVGIEIVETDRIDRPSARSPANESLRDALARRGRRALRALPRSMLRDPVGHLATVARDARDRASAHAIAMLRRALRTPAERSNRALSLSLNSRRLWTAGVPARGFLLSWVLCSDGSRRGAPDFLRIALHGVDSRTDESLNWDCPAVVVGDRLTMRLDRTREADAPTRRKRRGDATDAG
ncbi:hypothetical protein [Sorangium sp. So ce1000]|uniref:hypothetical protein n=1 Tax=Sorangium sp. So ce1000 TaxID=3133325 RepID=UPI003F61811B